MLKPSIRPQYIERIMTSQTGERYRVLFLVTLIDGEVKAKAISATRLEIRDLRLESPIKNCSKNQTILCLPSASAILKATISDLQSLAIRVSSFTSLLFFTSQPTRAPSRKL